MKSFHLISKIFVHGGYRQNQVCNDQDDRIRPELIEETILGVTSFHVIAAYNAGLQTWTVGFAIPKLVLTAPCGRTNLHSLHNDGQ